jgi:hypothetical protein
MVNVSAIDYYHRLRSGIMSIVLRVGETRTVFFVYRPQSVYESPFVKRTKRIKP